MLAKQQFIRWRPWLAAVSGYVLAETLARVLDLTPVSALTASSVAAVLHRCNVPVLQAGTVLHHPGGFAYEIGGECLGLAPILTLAGLLLTDRALPQGRALHAFALGAALLLLLNFIRLISLSWIGAELPQGFALAHNVLWPIALITTLLEFWHYAHRRQRTSALAATTGQRAPRASNTPRTNSGTKCSTGICGRSPSNTRFRCPGDRTAGYAGL